MEVHGGHIVRSTGRKDRHSKVCTAKGPRDRRVRLSAHTAIQFYDVQDRLGYDRPSKAVDWLIKKAKPAIDELAELPAWNPLAVTAQHASDNPTRILSGADPVGPGTSRGEGGRGFEELMENPSGSASFLPPSLDSDAIADTIKSFFPMGASAGSSSSLVSMQFQSQDLRLSLQSFTDPILLPHQSHHHHHHQNQSHESGQTLFSGAAHMGFDAADAGAGWPEIGRFERMVGWNAGGSGGGGFVFNSPAPAPPQAAAAAVPLLQPLFGESQMFSQRGPLQSSNAPSIRGWIDPSIAAAAAAASHQYQQTQPAMSPSFGGSGVGFASSRYSGFRIPARIQGEEEHDGVHHKPSSASSNSRH